MSARGAPSRVSYTRIFFLRIAVPIDGLTSKVMEKPAVATLRCAGHSEWAPQYFFDLHSGMDVEELDGTILPVRFESHGEPV